jgi:hypothetical protein
MPFELLPSPRLYFSATANLFITVSSFYHRKTPLWVVAIFVISGVYSKGSYHTNSPAGIVLFSPAFIDRLCHSVEQRAVSYSILLVHHFLLVLHLLPTFRLLPVLRHLPVLRLLPVLHLLLVLPHLSLPALPALPA